MKVGEDLKEAGGSAPRVSSRIVAADVRRRILAKTSSASLPRQLWVLRWFLN